MRRTYKLYLFLIANLVVSLAIAQPTSPEVSAFTQIGQTEMVDLATGDFSYNIPLMEIGGYPINLGYNAGVQMDQEASMVGLGWTLNAGAITRTMRGLPDDFKGDEIVTTTNMKKMETWGLNLGTDLELFGLKLPKLLDSKLGLEFSLGAYYNSYTGYGLEWVLGPSISANSKNKKNNYEIGFGISKKSTDIATTLQPKFNISDNEHGSSKLNIGTKVNSVDGVKEHSFRLGKSLLDLSINAGISSLYGSSSYTPSASDYDYKKSSFTYNEKIGSEAWGLFGNIVRRFYYTSNELDKNVASKKSYGYLYLDSSNSSSLIDVNRGNERGYIESCPNLSVPALMNDIFSVTGQGVSGTYRPYRNDIGVLFDPKINDHSNDFALGTNFGLGAGWKLGIDPKYSTTITSAGKWTYGNNIGFDFVSELQGSPLYEKVYFKSMGEKSLMSSELFNQVGGINPVSIKLNSPGNTDNTFAMDVVSPMSDIFNKHLPKIITDLIPEYFDELEINQKISLPQTTSIANADRAKRAQVFSYLTAGEASVEGATLYKKLQYFHRDYWLENSIIDEENRVDDNRRSHHISHCEVINTDGMRYQYSLPVYNNTYQEVVFNICNDDVDGDGLVDYNPSIDNTLRNENGRDHFYEKKSTPAYAHSYMLTSVLSPDYADLTGNGITDDDLGNAVKFNYFKHLDNYKWRFPYEKNQANFNGGFDSKTSDNKGNYLYGEKEIVYLQSIESKTQVAVFIYNNRIDAFEVLDHNGGQGEHSLLQLEEVRLYSKKELLENSNPIPLKTIHFNYNNTLVRQHPSNKSFGTYPVVGNPDNSGKLTLSEIYFTYNDNPKSKAEKYEFDYYNNWVKYDKRAKDRWGVYKPNNHNPADLDNTSFPYVLQPENSNDNIQYEQDNFVSEWNLNTITTPSGGEIKIEYESDDYSFVQNKEAMVMKPLLGINDVNANKLYVDSGGAIAHKNKILIKVPKGANKAEEHLKSDILYIRAYVNLFENYYEYVPTYINVTKKNLDTTPTDYDILELTIKLETTKDNGGTPINPITKSAIEFTKLNLNELLTTDFDPHSCDSLPEFDAGNLAKYALKNLTLLGNYYMSKIKKGHAQSLDLNKSYVRLNDINHKKLGGGLRVKTIEINDNWEDLSGGYGESTFYATDYFYTDSETGESSGVASYEPGVGGDENPFKLPIKYVDKKVLAPDAKYMFEEPIGEIHFPSPNIIYSETTQMSRRNDPDNPHAVGNTVSEFYTSKDFPTQFFQTSIEVERTPKISGDDIFSALHPFANYTIDEVSVSQGYSIVKNDMHGKPKSTFTYAQDQSVPLSGVEYIYKTDDNGFLNNQFDVIKPDGTKESRLIGVDYDMYLDMRNNFSSLLGIDAQFNAEGPVPPSVTVIPYLTSSITDFNSSVFQKVIYQYGLLDSIRVFDGSSEILTKNLALDSENSNVLVTKTYNEFWDPIYNTNYPAHWAYEGMEGAYQDIGALFEISSSVDGKITNSSIDLLPGTEILIQSKNLKAWVHEYGNDLYLIDLSGNLVKSISSDVEAKIIRSGHRNLTSSSIGQIKSKSFDYTDITENFKNNNDILDASAIEYSENWQTNRKPLARENPAQKYNDCFLLDSEGSEITSVNPYQYGVLGNWRPKRDYLYLTKRTNKDNGIRNAGVYEDFDGYWNSPDNSGESFEGIPQDRWIWKSKNEITNPYGVTLSTKDRLERYVSQIPGYQNQLIIASVFNSELRNSVNINFEDHIERSCILPHILNKTELIIVEDEAHSGNKSLRLKGYPHQFIVYNYLENASSIQPPPYELTENDVVPGFRPEAGDYLVSVWVKKKDCEEVSYEGVGVTIDDYGTKHELRPSGPIIEGWQKIEEIIEFSGDGTCSITFNQSIDSGSFKIFFDDFRMHPIDANMKTYVYDYVDHRLMAELDENNYSTFYEYDEEGSLIRIKKETERGVVTIQENRKHVQED